MPTPTKHSQKWQNDLALARSAAAGDREALRAFAKRMHCVPRFLAAANARKGQPLGHEDLADLSQDTLIIIWQKLETFKGHATLETWARHFCQFEFYNRVRALYRRKLTAAAVVQEAQYSQDTPLPPQQSDRASFSQLEISLVQLGSPTEEIIRMKHFELLIFEEIARRLNLPISTIKSRYYRGLLVLKSRLTDAPESL